MENSVMELETTAEERADWLRILGEDGRGRLLRDFDKLLAHQPAEALVADIRARLELRRANGSFDMMEELVEQLLNATPVAHQPVAGGYKLVPTDEQVNAVWAIVADMPPTTQLSLQGRGQRRLIVEQIARALSASPEVAEPVRGEAELEDVAQIREEIIAGNYRYRVVPTASGFEPQMLYIAGVAGLPFWMPLDAAGVWAEPASYSNGRVKGRYPLPTLDAANAAVARAKRINGERLLKLMTAPIEAEQEATPPDTRPAGEARLPDSEYNAMVKADLALPLAERLRRIEAVRPYHLRNTPTEAAEALRHPPASEDEALVRALRALHRFPRAESDINECEAILEEAIRARKGEAG